MQRRILFFLIAIAAGYPDGVQWKLALNIHGADGHDFGYEADAWEDDSHLGTDATAFIKDYKNYDVTLETANFIAIVRHHNGICEAARVWEFLVYGKTLQTYFDSQITSRLVATYNNHTSSWISPIMANKDLDPIFAEDGALTFNWLYVDNGVRIGNSQTYCSNGGLPAKNVNSDDYLGLGNSIGLKNSNPNYWVEVGVQDCGLKWADRAQGTDHGNLYKDGPLYGQYAVYISDEATTFPCEGIDLQVSMFDSDDDFLNWNEFIFGMADRDTDGFLSAKEYDDAIKKDMFAKTVKSPGNDFKRIDRDGDGNLSYLEIGFDAFALYRHSELSLGEYFEARAQKMFGKIQTDADVVSDFQRIDKDGDGKIDFLEILFDDADTNKDGELSAREYFLSHVADSPKGQKQD